MLIVISLNAIQNVGQLVSLPFCAFWCDRFGRRNALVFGAAIILLAVGLQGGAQSTAMFIGSRAVLGVGLALNITAAPLLIMELAHPSQAAPMVSIYNSLWGLGSLSAAWITYGSFRLNNDWAWRIPSLLQGASSALQVLLCFAIEESPRWLVSVGRVDEARALLVKYHANGDPQDPIIESEMEAINRAIKDEAEAQNSTSYLTFFQSRGNRRRFFIVLAVGFFSQWSGNGLVSYYLVLVLDSIGYKTQDVQTFINAMMTLWGMIVSIGFSLIVNRFRRRTLFLVSTIGCWASYCVWTGLEATYEKSLDQDGNGGNAQVASAVLAIILIFGTFYSVGWGTLQVTYPLEILPFELRARGLVLYNLFCALALIFNQYVNPIGIANSGWKFYITYDVWIAVEVVVVYFLFIETGGKANLEEAAKMLDKVNEGEHVESGSAIPEKGTATVYVTKETPRADL